MRPFIAGLAAGLTLCGVAQANPKSTDPAQVPAGTYVLDKRHASLIARVAHLGGFSRFTLRFDGLDGSFTYDPAAWAATPVTITVDARSAATGAAGLDKNVDEYFEVEKFPKIIFVGKSLTAVEGAKGKLNGELSFHGRTQPVTLDVTFNGVGPGLMGMGARLGFSGTGQIKRSDFGVNAVSQWVGDEVDLLIEVEFERK